MMAGVSAGAEAPMISGTSVFSGSDDARFGLSGITVVLAEGDEAMGGTGALGGLSAGWPIYDGATALTATGGVASLPVSDLSALRIAAPDGTGPASDSLTLTVSSSEGGLTTSGSEVLLLGASAAADAPLVCGSSVFSGSDEASFAL